MRTALSQRDAQDFLRLEKIVESGLAKYLEVGRALMEIKQRELYKAAADTWEIYLQERWGISRQHGHRLIKAAELDQVVSSMAPSTISEKTPSPTGLHFKTERQARRVLEMEAKHPKIAEDESREERLQAVLQQIKRDEAEEEEAPAVPRDRASAIKGHVRAAQKHVGKALDLIDGSVDFADQLEKCLTAAKSKLEAAEELT